MTLQDELAGPRATNPRTVPQGDAEDIAHAVNLAAYLRAGEVPTTPQATLTDERGENVVLADAATIEGTYRGQAGTFLVQRVRAGVLTPGLTYRLACRFTIQGTNTVLETVTGIVCDG